MWMNLFYVQSICDCDTGLCLDRLTIVRSSQSQVQSHSRNTSHSITSLFGGGGIMAEEDNIITPRARSFTVQISPRSSA